MYDPYYPLSVLRHSISPLSAFYRTLTLHDTLTYMYIPWITDDVTDVSLQGPCTVHCSMFHVESVARLLL